MNINLKSRLLILISGILFFFLFFAKPHYHSLRSLSYAWNLGHIICFFVWSLTYLNLAKNSRQNNFLKQSIFILTIALAAAILIEWVQTFFNRSADAEDVIKGLIGCLLAIAFCSPSRIMLPRKVLQSLQLIIVFIVAFESYPLASAFIDESIARLQFPVLADFETPFEIQRWKGDAPRTIARNRTFHGRSALKVSLKPTKYSGTVLRHFPENWQPFRFLEFSIFNASPRVLKITCSVHDRIYMRYHDRFNKRFTLIPGWNTIRIATDDIQQAPKDRQMNMADIQSVRIFTTRLPQPETIYIDYVRLLP